MHRHDRDRDHNHSDAVAAGYDDNGDFSCKGGESNATSPVQETQKVNVNVSAKANAKPLGEPSELKHRICSIIGPKVVAPDFPVLLNLMTTSRGRT